MSDNHTPTTLLDVDETWLSEWAAEGLLALEDYLAKHRAFHDFLRARGDDERGGDSDR